MLAEPVGGLCKCDQVALSVDAWFRDIDFKHLQDASFQQYFAFAKTASNRIGLQCIKNVDIEIKLHLLGIWCPYEFWSTNQSEWVHHLLFATCDCSSIAGCSCRRLLIPKASTADALLDVQDRSEANVFMCNEGILQYAC